MPFLWSKERIYFWFITGDGRETAEKGSRFIRKLQFPDAPLAWLWYSIISR